MIRLLMIIGIIFIHIPHDTSLVTGHAFAFFKAFITDGVFRAAVPVLTTLSGYLLFVASSDQRVFGLLKKKVRTLLIPLILWNLPIVVLVYWVQRFEILNHPFSEQLYPFNFRTWLDGLVGLTKAPVNYPLNFIRDLFALALLAPLLGLLLRHIPYIGLGCVLIVYWYDLDGLFLIRESMLISFYLGGLMAVQKWDLTALDPYAWVLLPLFFGAAFFIVYFEIEKIDLYRVCSPFLVWPVVHLIVSTSVGNFLYRNSRHSFFIYLSCGPILFFLWVIYAQYFPGLPYEVFWCVTPLFIIVICILLSRYLHRWFPAATGILLGNR